MKGIHISSSKNKNIFICTGLGLATALIISTAASFVLTSLIEKSNMNESGQLGVFLTRIISVAIGGLVGTGLSDNKLLPIIIAVSVTYLTILIAIGVILFDASIKSLGLGLSSILIGAAISLLIKLKPQRRGRKMTQFKK